MESFQWADNFVTGLDKVDSQHQCLVDSINQFSSILAENEVHVEDVHHLYSQLADYAIYHFSEEEKLMLTLKLDQRHTAVHLNEHKNFINTITAIYHSISLDNIDQARSFLKFLIHWLAHHILFVDQDMARQVKAIETGIVPQEAYNEKAQKAENATEPLLAALNSLFDQVTARNKELQKLNESLEEKVAARTQELLEANQHLEELSLTDVLTELPNRRHAMRYLASLWYESIQTNAPLVCMLVDADHFKQVNDTYGHDAGDVVLIELAKTLQRSLRNDDIVCRLGGDEFLVICPNTDHNGGMHIAEITREAVSELQIPTGEGFWQGSVSIGVAHRSAEMSHYEELIKEADKGVYLAKDAGKNAVRACGINPQ